MADKAKEIKEKEIITRTAADKKFIEKLEAEGTVTIVVGTEEQIEKGGYADVGINGVFWRIKYGEKITVPKAVARLLNEGKYAVSVQGAY